MKRLFLLLLISSGICSTALSAENWHNKHKNVIYHANHAAALLDEASQGCAEYIRASPENFLFSRTTLDAGIQQRLLSGCSFFDSSHDYYPCQKAETFTLLIKPYIDSLHEASADAKNFLYLAAFQRICHNQPLVLPEGNQTAISLYHIFQRKTDHYAMVANQPAWVSYCVVGGFFTAFMFLVFFEFEGEPYSQPGP